MTIRAKLIAFLCLLLLCLGIGVKNPFLAYLALTILVWMVIGFVQFRWSARRTLRSIQVIRRIQGREQNRSFLWAGRRYRSEWEVTSKGWFQVGWMIRDVMPDILSVTSTHSLAPVTHQKQTESHASFLFDKIAQILSFAESHRTGIEPHAHRIMQATKSMRHEYTIQPLAAGIAVLPGLRLEFFDAMGWYRIDHFVHCRQTLQVLPGYRGRGELRQLLKHNNAIPQHGMHRQRRPGMGFELLELREYAEGDPPKTIAWKASARRETLMTRQYESEVPIRVQLFLEGTVACRIGSFGRRVIDQMNMIAASVAKITIRGGDWIGGYLINGDSITRVPSSTGEAGFHRIAQALSEFSCSEFPNRFRWTLAMQEATYALMSEYYPDLLKSAVNPQGFTSWVAFRSKSRRQRVQLSCVLAERYHLSDIDHVQLLVDDDRLAGLMQRFLCEHGRAWVPPMIPAQDVPKFLSQRSVDQLVKSIHQAVTRAKDNEVFIVIVDLLSSARSLDELMSALRMAKGRHHRVVVISQSPDFEKPISPQLTVPKNSAPQGGAYWRALAEKVRVNERMTEGKRQLQELGIPFSVTSDESAIPTILAEVDLARTGRVASRGGATSR